MVTRFLTTLILSIFFVTAMAQGYGLSFIDEPYQPKASTTAGTSTPIPETLQYITDSLISYRVADTTFHQVGFQIPAGGWPGGGLLGGRMVVITLPSDFDLSTISAIWYSDTDHSNDNAYIEWVYVYSESVVVLFSEEFPGPVYPYYAYLTLRSVGNSVRADNYQIVVQIDDVFGTTLAGPNFSQEFILEPDEPVSLSIAPAGDLDLIAGDSQQFTAAAVDRFDNPISSDNISWAIDLVNDIIGNLSGSFFKATTVGSGRVMAQSGDLTAYSGYITVSPGTPAAFNISSDSYSATAGLVLNGDVIVEVVDSFANRVVDYDKAVWFSSSDTEAEFYHDETNPYQFNGANQGRRIFAGSQFVFKTAGTQILTVQDGSIDGSQDFSVSAAMPVDLTISYPPDVRAGDLFELQISDLRDSFGNFLSGTVTIAGAENAPDGTLPQITDIIVTAGQGSGLLRLFKAGDNTIDFAIESFEVQKIITISPGETVGALIPEIDSIQFTGNNLRGTARVTAYDDYSNVKTDMNLTGMDLSITAEMGTIVPDLVYADAFIDGVADLSGFSYQGQPGRTDITISTQYIDPSVSGIDRVVFNGIYLFPDDDGRTIPESLLNNWGFMFDGTAVNTGNLTPGDVSYEAGYLEISSSTTDLILKSPDCIPLPGNSSGCGFRLNEPLYANTDEASLTFYMSAGANYEYGGENYTAVTAYTSDIEVLPFDGFELENIDLPSFALVAPYSDNGSLSLLNTGQYDDASLNLKVYARNEINNHWLAQTLIKSYNWPDKLEIPFAEIQFNENIQPGDYDYYLGLSGKIINYDDNTILYYTNEYILDQAVAIAERAQYEFDAGSLNPALVTVGTDIVFSFNVNLIGSTEVVLDGTASYLRLTGGGITVDLALDQSNLILTPGANTLITEEITVPDQWENLPLSAQLILVGVEAEKAPVNTQLDFTFPLTIEATPEIQIISFELEAPNPPFVNVGQAVALKGRIVNYSPQTIPGPIYLDISTDGNSLGQEKVNIELESLEAEDTVTIVYNFYADENATPIEQFTFEVQPITNVKILTPLDNLVSMIVQEEPKIFISPQIVDIPGVVPTIDFGEQFQIRVTFAGLYQYNLEGGSLSLNYTGTGDFDLDFPAVEDLDSVITWQMTAPEQVINGEFVIQWYEIPIDLNTGQQAQVSSDPISIQFAIRAADVRLLVVADSTRLRPLVRGVSDSIMYLYLKNGTDDNRSSIQLDNITVDLIDKDGREIDASDLVDSEFSGFYDGSQKVGEIHFLNGRLAFNFNDFILVPGEERTITMYLQPMRDASYDYFQVVFSGDLFGTTITNGPREGEAAHVSGLNNQPFDVSLRQAVIAESLGDSFKNYPNPFNPTRESTEIRYKLITHSNVDIMIFTATGEKVLQMSYAAGDNGGLGGDTYNSVYWDGRNGNGDMVMNGVYIALIKVSATGEMAKLKIAVAK